MARTGSPRRILRAGLATYIVLLHALVLFLALKTNFLLLAGKTLGLIPAEEWNPDLVSRILEQARTDETVAPGLVALIGDSGIARLDSGLPGVEAVNFGIGGGTIRTLTSRLPTLRSLARSRAVVLEVGVNDLKYRPIGQIAQDYAALLSRLPSSPALLVVSVLPVDERGPAARHRSYLRNDKIAAINRDIRVLCAARDQCRFLDVWPAMLGQAVYSGDGWHLSGAGSAILAGAIRDALPAAQ